MSQIPTRLNLSAMTFPLLSNLSGRGIVVKQTDQNYVAAITSREDLDKDIGIPTLYYCHNIIATAQGYEAIDYVENIPALALTNFTGIFLVLESGTGNKAYIGYTDTGDFYYCVDPTYSWTFVQNIAAAAGKRISTGYVNGVTYIYVANVGAYKFNFGTHLLNSVTLTALVPANILGITSAQGYLIAWSVSTLYWSSLIDPTDFTPSLATGAGSGSVQNARGDLVTVVPHTIGMIVYTNQNAVAAPASGNARYPWNFRELVASGGIKSSDLITYDANTGSHYAYTTSGIQMITMQQTQTVMPEVTDFLAGSVFEDFDEDTNSFNIYELSTTLKKRLALVSDRYLVISYGISEFTHALIYDTVFKRWSKLRHTHVEVFEFNIQQAEVVETPRRSIALLENTGRVAVVKIDAMNASAHGVVLLGKLQYVRQRLVTLHTLAVENVPQGSAFTCTDLYSLDGKNATAEKVGYELRSIDLFREYAFNTSAINHSFLFKGAFNLVSLVAYYSVHGRR